MMSKNKGKIQDKMQWDTFPLDQSSVFGPEVFAKSGVIPR